MTPELSHRLGEAIGGHYAALDEQETIREAVRTADTWDELPAEVQALVERIEARPAL